MSVTRIPIPALSPSLIRIPVPLLQALCLLALLGLLLACGDSKQALKAEQDIIEFDLLYDLPAQPMAFREQVQPVLEKRCVVCHACYDAPCQLKLGSAAGIQRGANPQPVYDASRLLPADPTRLFIDAMSTAQWRQKGFHPVLNEDGLNEAGLNEGGNNGGPVRNLQQSVMYRMLQLKQRHPQARTGKLDARFDLSLGRRNACPSIDEFESYARQHPEGGMPYAMPNLAREEYKTLVHWLAQGAPVAADLAPSAVAEKQIREWEAFLNGRNEAQKHSKKRQLVARYLYEHWFQAHLHFEGTGEREFYRLVRSTTPPGEPVAVIATRRPYGWADGPVYYRILRQQGSIVAKQHMVFPLSAARMQRLQQWFFEADYEVTELPSYEPAVASNPIKAFAAIPVKSRYRFLLDDARFYIEGFIKGPVCRGQIALSVIEDQFWLAFFDPDAPIASNDDDFLRANADYMAMPNELEDTFRLLSVNMHYKDLFRQLVKGMERQIEDFQPVSLKQAMNFLWDGRLSENGRRRADRALTIFRHLDSASVNFGWLGDYPETAWILDYSVLERIHYLLVAGYDVYGNAGHQLNTRLYMDLLRTEGEDYFLAFLPPATREQLYQDWYQGLRKSNKNDQGQVQWRSKELVTGYRSAQPQRELYHRIADYLALPQDDINRCQQQACQDEAGSSKHHRRADHAMRELAKMKSEAMQFLPDLAFIRVRTGEGAPDLAYTLIYNKAYKNVSNMMQTEKPGERRDYAFDTITILPWLEGSYPNFFYVVDIDELDAFVVQYKAIRSEQEYAAFVMRYGIRRTHEDFWVHADWFNAQYAREQPLLSGIYDLNRYQNR